MKARLEMKETYRGPMVVLELDPSEAQKVEAALYEHASALMQRMYPADQEEAQRVARMAQLIEAARLDSYKWRTL